MNGRPSRSEQVQIQKTLRTQFERGTSATYAAKVTGMNIKTVCKYFDEWTRQIFEIEKKDFVIRQKISKERAILNLDYMIFELYKLLDEIKAEIKTYKTEKKLVPKHLWSMNFDILKTIADFTQQKLAFGMTRTVDVSMKEIIEKSRDGYYAKPITELLALTN